MTKHYSVDMSLHVEEPPEGLEADGAAGFGFAGIGFRRLGRFFVDGHLVVVVIVAVAGVLHLVDSQRLEVGEPRLMQTIVQLGNEIR